MMCATQRIVASKKGTENSRAFGKGGEEYSLSWHEVSLLYITMKQSIIDKGFDGGGGGGWSGCRLHGVIS